MEIYDLISKFNLGEIDINQFIIRVIISFAIIAGGIFLGKILSLGMKKLFKKIEIEKKIKGGFVDLFIVIIRWSIYIIFLSWGLKQLSISSITNFLTNILLTIPALVGALILILIGFVIASYLKQIIKNSDMKGWETISQVIFYFTFYIFGVYAIKTALILLDEQTTNLIIIALTVILSSAVAYVSVKRNLKE